MPALAGAYAGPDADPGLPLAIGEVGATGSEQVPIATGTLGQVLCHRALPCHAIARGTGDAAMPHRRGEPIAFPGDAVSC